MLITWFDGHLSHKKHSLIVNDNKIHEYSMEILDIDGPPLGNTIHEIFYSLVAKRTTKYVEVLYSGGVDSELVLKLCLLNNIPVRALSMRLLLGGIVFNTHDIYYSEKFCREHKIERKVVDLQVEKLFENGDYLSYLIPYFIIEPHVATHLWLFEQSTGFPIIGGDYYWPWYNKKIISPQRLAYNSYNRFLKDRNIEGIGNMLSHATELSTILMRSHLKIYDPERHAVQGMNFQKLSTLKHEVLRNINICLEPRLRGFGWENQEFYIRKFKAELVQKIGTINHTIIWNKKIADALDGTPGSNDKFR